MASGQAPPMSAETDMHRPPPQSCPERKKRQDAGVWVKGVTVVGALMPEAAAFSADGLDMSGTPLSWLGRSSLHHPESL